MKPFDEEIVSGSILRSVWKLAWPVTLLNLVNGMHGFVDNALVGHYLKSPDNAANVVGGAHGRRDGGHNQEHEGELFNQGEHGASLSSG